MGWGERTREGAKKSMLYEVNINITINHKDETKQGAIVEQLQTAVGGWGKDFEHAAATALEKATKFCVRNQPEKLPGGGVVETQARIVDPSSLREVKAPMTFDKVQEFPAPAQDLPGPGPSDR